MLLFSDINLDKTNLLTVDLIVIHGNFNNEEIIKHTRIMSYIWSYLIIFHIFFFTYSELFILTNFRQNDNLIHDTYYKIKK